VLNRALRNRERDAEPQSHFLALKGQTFNLAQ
jgi:hypothetical protein